MKKAKRLLPILIVCGTLGVGLWTLWDLIVTARPVFLITTSPSETYTVSIAGQKDRPLLPVLMNTVRFSVIRRSETFLVNQYLHTGDWFDASFADLYPQYRWASENVLHLFSAENFSGGDPIKLIVKNSSGETIKYLLIDGPDAHLLFDVQSNSQIELKVPPPNGNLFWVSVEGQYNDARPLKGVGQDFIVNKKQATLYVDVNNTGATFESPDWGKYVPQ